MIDKLERLLRKWFNAKPKDTYLKLLEQFDRPDATMVELPAMLVEFWKRVNPKHFVDGPTVRDMMYIDIEPRHLSVSELENLLRLVTGALIHNDEKMVMDISTDLFSINQHMTLDDYFSGTKGGTLKFSDGVAIMKRAIVEHGDAIETLEFKYHYRVLNRMYNDILYITRVIVDNMKETD